MSRAFRQWCFIGRSYEEYCKITLYNMLGQCSIHTVLMKRCRELDKGLATFYDKGAPLEQLDDVLFGTTADLEPANNRSCLHSEGWNQTTHPASRFRVQHRVSVSGHRDVSDSDRSSSAFRFRDTKISVLI